MKAATVSRRTNPTRGNNTESWKRIQAIELELLMLRRERQQDFKKIVDSRKTVVT
jgi:hypothetical protein